MTKWFHKVDLDWLKARQKCLTATDVKELLPVTKTGRKRSVGDGQYLKVLSRKLVNLTEEDCLSTGAAARGHILEPYAIDRYNKEDFGGNERLWHWDDTVITKANHVWGGLAFSPDAMNFEQAIKHPIMMDEGNDIICIGEVKSYAAEKHLMCGHTPKGELEERWQIATAMAVCEDIRTAYLLFYNPSMAEQLYIVDYDRSDLIDEIETVSEIEKNWLVWVASFGKLSSHYTVIGKIDEEEAIIRSIMEKEKLDPCSFKSVE